MIGIDTADAARASEPPGVARESRNGHPGESWRAGNAAPTHPAAPARQLEPAVPTATQATMMPLPKRWASTDAIGAWQWFGRARAPLPVMIAGAEGGVGTSLVAALTAETIAAASPGPTVAVDQSGTPWGAMSRRLLGERAGFPGHLVQHLLREQTPPGRILEATPTSSAGVAVVDDGPAYTPLRELFVLARATCGVMVTDSGRVDVVLPARMDPVPLLVLVGRADVVGAEAVCASLEFLQRRAASAPIVVLSSTAPGDLRKIRAAQRLVQASGSRSTLIHLPHNARFSAGPLARLDEIPKPAAAACVQLLIGIIRATTGSVP